MLGKQALTHAQLQKAWELALKQLKQRKKNTAQYNKGRLDNHLKVGGTVMFRNENKALL